MILTVSNLKGGSSKTTTAAFLAHALAEQGLDVVIVDADPQASISRWAEYGDWKIPVRGMAVPRLHVPSVGVDREAAGADVVVIDTPPTEKEKGIAESAIKAATHVVVPVAPTSMEIDRMAPIRELIDDVAELGRHAAPPVSVAMFTRTHPRALATSEYRDLLVEAGWNVLRSQVGTLQRYAQAFGGPVEDALNSSYGDALLELQAL